MFFKKSSFGFSLIELMVAMIISMTLISASSFYFKDFSRDEEMRDTLNKLVANIKLVKNEKLYSSKSFIIKSTNDKLWNQYQITLNGTVSETVSVPSGYTMRSNVDGFSFRDDGFLIHDSGAATGYNFTFTICDNKRTGEKGKKVEIGVLGEIIYDEINCA